MQLVHPISAASVRFSYLWQCFRTVVSNFIHGVKQGVEGTCPLHSLGGSEQAVVNTEHVVGRGNQRRCIKLRRSFGANGVTHNLECCSEYAYRSVGVSALVSVVFKVEMKSAL